MPFRLTPSLFLLAAIAVSHDVNAQTAKTDRSIAELTSAAQKIDGFVPMFWDNRQGKMWLELERFDQEFLYVASLSAGVGSNDLGLDRGKMEEPKVVRFERSGPKVLLIESNYGFRASNSNPAEQRAARDSFARSTLWGFEVAAEDRSHVLIDASAFFLRDAAQVGEVLTRARQGSYRIDPTRSAFYLPLTKGFPKNSEVETTVTFTGESNGKLIRSVTPTPEAVTVREHQSFVQLPEPGYQPRLQDPRSSFSSIDYMDFSAPVDEPVEKRLIARHRLIKKDPKAEVSEPVEPLVYYVDPGAPADVRAALTEGAGWWNQAFEAAGFKNAFQVREFPADADPMDIRFNLIQWVHRSTRGWSYGNSLVDPRTGEIIKGIVTLGSLRAHQDAVIFQSLLGPFQSGSESASIIRNTIYARLRQLAAHEVGHTLGLEHNYIASTEGRASVMDYPHPLIGLGADGKLDFSKAYATGIGAWDKVSIRWGYGQFPPGTDEHAALNKIITDAAAQGLTFITDADSRPLGSAHPRSHLWDNGSNATDGLQQILAVRSAALAKFGQNNIAEGTPMATLDETLVPLYFLHRYQTEAAAKEVGGSEYTYALRGDGEPVTSMVPGSEQKRALKMLLQTISPATLTIPDQILRMIPPRPPAYPRTRETFPNRTGVTFDPLAGAEAAADQTVGLLLNSQRASRLVQYHSQASDCPGLAETIDAIMAATWHNKPEGGLRGEVAHTVNYIVLSRLMALAADGAATPEARAIASMKIGELKRYLDTLNDPPMLAQRSYALTLIRKFETDPKQLELPSSAEAPPGQPIGEDDDL